MSDFGFIGQAYTAASITQNDQELINWYCEVDQTKDQGERGVIALYPTPGLTTVAQLAVAEVRGFHVNKGGQTLIAVSGNTVYSVNTSYAATTIGTLASSSGPVSITDNGVAAYIVDGSTRYSYVFSTGAFQTENDGAFTGADVCDELDNFIIYNNPGTNQFGSTNVGDISSGALNFGSKIGYSDNIKAVVADHRQILVIGEVYSERWIGAGTFPFNFAILPGTSIQHGIEATFSIARLGEGIAYLSKDTRGNANVVMWGAALPQPQRISTFAVENAIQSYAVTDDAIGYSYSQAGHEFYILNFPTEDVTWCYDISTAMWHKRLWRDPSTGLFHRHRSNCMALFNGQVIAGDFENGKIYTVDQNVYTDDSNPVRRLRRCRHLTTNLNRQFFADLQIQFQPGPGLQSGQGSNPQCVLRWSNDGGFTWGNDHLLTIGKVGQYRHRVIKRRLGYARDRVFEVSMADPVYGAVVSANLNASAGAS